MGKKDRTVESLSGPSDTEGIDITVKLASRHIAHLDEVCKMREITRDEAIELALKSYLREYARRARLSAFGFWKKRERKGVDVQAALRGKW